MTQSKSSKIPISQPNSLAYIARLNSPTLFAEVIIPLALPKNYTWAVPDNLQPQAKPGVRVEVVLGKNKKYAGVIKRLHTDKPTAFEAKDILNVLDAEPIVFP